MIDYRVKVEVTFTIDVGLTNPQKLLEAERTAAIITRQVFQESFTRAHLLTIKTEELMTWDRKSTNLHS